MNHDQAAARHLRLFQIRSSVHASEIRNNQKVKELLHKQKTEPSVVFTQKDLAHFVTFAEAASLIATFVQPETIPPSAFWLVEWRYDKSKLFVETPAQTTQQYEALILSLASQHLKNQSDMLGKYGIYPIGVSRSSATDLLRSFRRPTDSTKQITGRMVSFTPKTPPPASYIAGFTIAFYYYKLHSDSNPPKPEYLQDILGEPFHIGGGRIIELDPPVQAGA